jgi:L-ribulose-5-phosphate 3-epimerase
MNRREAVKKSILLSSGAFLAPNLFAKDPVPKYKIGACDWSIKRMLELEAFRFGKQLGLDGIQFSFDEAGKGMDLRVKENREAVRQTIKKTGVAISSLAIGALNRIPFASTETGEQLVIDCIQTMATMKQEASALEDAELASMVSPEIVLVAFFSDGDINGRPDLIAKVIEKLKRIAPSAEKHGLTLGLETWLNEEDHRHILESVDSPAVKVYYDVANSNKMGYDIYEEIQNLGTENICQVHCKENGFLLGRGRIAFERLRGVLRNIDYQGWLVIESAIPKGMELDRAYQQNLDYLRSVFT